MLWYLWSQNRQEVPEGIYSHETALSLHELSDIMPSKLHMTVPTDFRRNSMIPEILILHRAHVDKSDVQEMYGVRVTRPMRTIIDLLRSSQVDRSQLKLAVNDAIRRGLETQKSIPCRPMIYNARFVSGRAVSMTQETKSYKTAGAFRTALETRLQARARQARTCNACAGKWRSIVS